MGDNILGESLIIPDGLVDDLEKIDKALENIKKNGVSAGQTLKTAFSGDLNGNVNSLAYSLEKVSMFLDKISSSSLGNLAPSTTKVAEDFTKVGTSAESASVNISELAQSVTRMTNYGGVGTDLFKFDVSAAGAETLKLRLVELEALITRLKKLRNEDDNTKAYDQQLTNQIRAIEEVLRVSKQSEAERAQIRTDRATKAQALLDKETQNFLDAQQKMYNKAADEANKEIELREKVHQAKQKELESTFKQSETNALSEQNRLLNERITLQRQISNLDIISQKNVALGNKEALSKDQLDILQSYRDRLSAIDKQLLQLQSQYSTFSEKAQQAFDTRNAQAYIAWQKQTIDYQEKLNKELVKANEIASASNKSTIQPTSEELSAQRKITSLYAEKLRYETEFEKVQNTVKLSAKSASVEQQQYMDYLQSSAREVQNKIDNLAKSYPKIGENAKLEYLNDWQKMAEKSAYDLANAQQKINEAQSKSNNQKLIKEYRELAAENEKLNAAMQRFDKLGASATFGSGGQQYFDVASQYQQNLTRMNELERKGIDEIAELRRQANVREQQERLDLLTQAKQKELALAKQKAKEESDARIQEYQRYINSYEGAMRAYSKLGTRSSGNYADTYDNEVRVLKQLENALARLADTQGANKDKADQLRESIQRLNSQITQYKAEVAGKIPTIASATDAYNISQQTKSLNSLKIAYEQLKAVMKTLDSDSTQFNSLNQKLQKVKGQIDDVRRKMGELKEQTSQAGGVAGQLQRRFAAVFSVAAISGFVQKMIDVRAQFELQRVALGAILKDAEKANEVFTQVQQMALKSPFSIMQLERSTKQLAAFGVEADKLQPTVKMLADISAGLGVEIDRINLVYGHIKAQNYLQGIHTRMFTNMGLNIYGELSKYYSELEGQMVSVAQVQKRVHDRMVSFQDVEAVLQRITSSSGMFYDMQKKQADSLWGQMQRIKDQMDLMLNDIGQSNEGVIKGFLSTIRSVMSNWRAFANILSGVAVAASLYAVKMIQLAVANGTFTASASGMIGTLAKFKTVMTSVAATLSNNPWILAVAGVVVLGKALYDLNDNMLKMQATYDKAILKQYKSGNQLEELSKKISSNNEQIKATSENIKNTKVGTEEHTQATNDNSEAIKEQNRTLEELRNKFPDVYAKITQTKDGIVDATKAIDEFNDSARGAAILLTMLKGDAGWFRDDIKTNFDEMSTANDEAEAQTVKLTASYEAFVAQTQAEYETEKAKGQLTKSTLETYQKILELRKSNLSVEQQAREIVEWYTSQHPYETLGKALNIFANDAFTNLTSAYTKANVAVRDFETASDRAKYNADKLQQYMLNLGGVTSVEMWKKLPEETRKKVEEMGQVAIEQLNLTLDDIQKQMLRKTIEIPLGITFSFDKKDIPDKLTPYQQAINDYIKKNNLTDKLGLKELLANDDADQYMGRVQTQLDDKKKKLKQLTTASVEIEADGNKQRRKQLEEEIKTEQKMLDDFGLHKEEKGKKGKKGRDIWETRLSLIQKMNSEYQKLLNYYDKETAKSKVLESYKKSVSQAFAGTELADTQKWIGLDKESLIKVYQAILDSAPKMSKEAHQKMEEELGKIKAEIEIEVQDEQLQKLKDEFDGMFKNYDLTVEVDKIGLDEGFVDLFGGESVTKEQIRERIAQEKEYARQSGELGKKRLQELEGYEKKLTDIERKEVKDRITNYAKYLTYAYGEAAKLQIDTYTNLAKIRKDIQDEQSKILTQQDGLDPNSDQYKDLSAKYEMFGNQLNRITDNMVNEMNQKLNKMDWEQFKGSDIFTQMYQDVEQLSGRAIDKLITQLTELREKMQATNDVDYKAVREVTKYIEKLKDTKATISPFSELSKSLKEVNRLRKEGKTLESEQLNLIQQNNEIKAADDDITKYETIIGLKEKINKKEIDETDLTKEQRDLLKQELPILESFLASAKERKKQAQENANASQDNIDIYEKALRETQAAQNQMTQLQQYAESITNSLIEGMDAFGVGIDESTSQLIKTFVNAIFQAIALDLQLKALELQAKKMGVAFNSALGVIGWIAIALEAVVSVFTALFNASDKKKEKAITKLQQKVEDLARAYDKLGEAMQKAFAFDDYEIGYTKSIDNIEEQIADYKKMIALEQSKKKTDDDKVREYQQAIEDLEDDLAELKETRITDLGGFGESNYEDIAEDFVSTWLDAFKETGDGLDDLNDKWDEYVENLFVKQAAYKRAGQLYQKAMDIIDNAIDNGVSGEDLQSYIELAKEAAQQANIDLNDYLKQLAEIFGISQEGENTLSDLQQGISNITEEQAAAVEAYLNSIRFYVASQDSKLSDMADAIREQYTNGISPLLDHVKAIRNTLTDIRDTFKSVVRTSGGNSYIKVN